MVFVINPEMFSKKLLAFVVEVKHDFSEIIVNHVVFDFPEFVAVFAFFDIIGLVFHFSILKRLVVIF